MIAIIDYDAGNIKSVEKAFQFLGENIVVTRDRETIMAADGVVLPGVGAFGDAMEKLHSYKLADTIKEVAKSGKPFLGICLGLQLMFESSDEALGVEGLGILPGKIVRIPDGEDIKVPHIGWNSLSFPNKGRLYKDLEENCFVYFVHSYYLQAGEPEMVVASTEYGVDIHASVEKGNVFACQFHPEKSSTVGLKILENFISVVKGEA